MRQNLILNYVCVNATTIVMLPRRFSAKPFAREPDTELRLCQCNYPSYAAAEDFGRRFLQGTLTTQGPNDATPQRRDDATAQRCNDATPQRWNGATTQRRNGATAQRRNDATTQCRNAATPQRHNDTTAQRRNDAMTQRCKFLVVNPVSFLRNVCGKGVILIQVFAK